MNKEEILKLSQQENKGKKDEREIAVSHKATSIAMAVGVCVCSFLMLLESLVLESDNISVVSWMVLSIMLLAEHLYLYIKLRSRFNLVWLIVAAVVAVIYTGFFVQKIITGEIS